MPLLLSVSISLMLFASNTAVINIPRGADAIEALEALKTGRIKPVIGATLKLWDAPKAHEMLEKGEVFGKILLSVR
jgi:NADPH:quinone reductase-like Zn-dependent oxidoreductase